MPYNLRSNYATFDGRSASPAHTRRKSSSAPTSLRSSPRGSPGTAIILPAKRGRVYLLLAGLAVFAPAAVAALMFTALGVCLLGSSTYTRGDVPTYAAATGRLTPRRRTDVLRGNVPTYSAATYRRTQRRRTDVLRGDVPTYTAATYRRTPAATYTAATCTGATYTGGDVHRRRRTPGRRVGSGEDVRCRCRYQPARHPRILHSAVRHKLPIA